MTKPCIQLFLHIFLTPILKRRPSPKPFIKREPNNAGLVSVSQINSVTSCPVSNLARVFQYIIVLIRSLKNGFRNGLVEFIYIRNITGLYSTLSVSHHLN